MTSIVAATTVATSGGAPDINTTGAAKFVWGSGSAVSGGVLTLAPGVYWLVLASDSLTLALSNHGDTKSSNIANATTATGIVTATKISAFSNTVLVTGSGGTLAIPGNIASMVWNNSNSAVPLVALVN